MTIPVIISTDQSAAPATNAEPVDPSIRIAVGIAPYTLYTSGQQGAFLAVLFLVTTSNYFDSNVLSVVLEPIKSEFHVSDTMLGLLSGIFFALVFALAGLPIARWADRGNRRTVISLALVGWSVMTALCGFAQSFWQLAIARFGLGATESGALPPAQSLIADYFPPDKRGMASAVLNAGTSAGYLVGVVFGGYIAASYGWRFTFIWGGALGLVLAIIARLTLAEPRQQLGFPAATHAESIGLAFVKLRGKPTFVWALVAMSVFAIFIFGSQTFMPAFMMRTLHATLTQVSVSWGIAISAANLVGTLFGGWLGDRLSRKDVRWHAWLSAVGCSTAAPLYWLALAAHRLSTFIIVDSIAEFVLAIGTAVCFVPILAVCGTLRRTTGMAIVQLSFMLVGGGLGPLMVGMLSDSLDSIYGADSLRYSLNSIIFFLFPAAAAFYWVGSAMPRDLED